MVDAAEFLASAGYVKHDALLLLAAAKPGRNPFKPKHVVVVVALQFGASLFEVSKSRLRGVRHG